jgi:hypothetical protein
LQPSKGRAEVAVPAEPTSTEPLPPKTCDDVRTGECSAYSDGDLFEPDGQFIERPFLERVHDIGMRWGLSPDAPPGKRSFPMGQKFANAVKRIGRDYPAERVADAVASTLDRMEAEIAGEPSEKGRRGYGSALAYFESTLAGKLAKMQKEALQIGAVAAEVEIKLNGARIADDMKREALGALLELGNQAAAKRIEAGSAAAKSNGYAQPAGNSRTYINEDGKRRYRPDFKLIPLIGLFGDHADKLFDELEPKGATFEEIDAAFGKENGKSGDRTESRDEVLRSVRRTIMCKLDKRRDVTLKAEFGEPEGLCGGDPHPLFKHEWICISREKVAEILAQCPDVKPIDGVWRGTCNGHNWNEENLLAEKFRQISSGRWEIHNRVELRHDDYGTGMQARVEAELLQAMLEEQREAQIIREKREREAAQREANALLQLEEAEERRQQWEAERPERERLERERREKREAEEAARRAAEESEAENLNWDSLNLTVTKAGMEHLQGVDANLLVAVLKTLGRSITDPIARRQGPVTTNDMVELWRDLLRRAQWMKGEFSEIRA